MTESLARIGQLTIPATMQRLIKDGRWKPPTETSVIVEVFSDEPDWVQFYDLTTMAAQNRLFQTKSQVEIAEEVPGSGAGIGCDPSLAVIIGSLGADMPIVLDYRQEQSNPRVIYLGSDGWREIAPDFDTLGRLLGL